MAVKETAPFTFVSLSRPFQPFRGASAAFGGHVLAQSIVVAGKTAPGYTVVGSHSYFLLAVDADIPLEYSVKVVRDSKMYAHRMVAVTQEQESVYEALITLKVADPEDTYNYQAQLPPIVADGFASIAEYPECPDADTIQLKAMAQELAIRPHFHPIECRKMNTTEYNHLLPLERRRIVHYFKSRYSLDDANIRVAALAYISDRNSLFTIINIQDNPDVDVVRIASLNHAFILHDLPPRISARAGWQWKLGPAELLIAEDYTKVESTPETHSLLHSCKMVL